MAERNRHVTFPSAGRPTYLLEGSLGGPLGSEAQGTCAGAVLCHPQPATSSMDDPLLSQVAARLTTDGLLALRFNFRGVGESEGQQTDGRLEPLDIAGAIEFLLQQPAMRSEKLCLIGHGFGAYLALAYAAHDPRIGAVVAISPPLFRVSPELGAFNQPRLFMTGEYDEVAPRHKMEPWIAQLPGARMLKIISGARHLMRGYEAIAAEVVVQYVTQWAAQPAM
ncbi:MAG: alpha/beta fold hydrolase [Ktedonobacterales bacterium]|nr:alpha/beta fold hydrolase [Ktedonobacterales bacterium]